MIQENDFQIVNEATCEVYKMIQNISNYLEKMNDNMWKHELIDVLDDTFTKFRTISLIKRGEHRKALRRKR